MGKSRKDYEKFLNSISPDRDDETWIIGDFLCCLRMKKISFNSFGKILLHFTN